MLIKKSWITILLVFSNAAWAEDLVIKDTNANPMFDLIIKRDYRHLASLSRNLSYVSSRTPEGYTVLHQVGTFGTPQMATLLLDAKAQVDVVTEDGETPLMAAIIAKNYDVANIYIDRGADTSIATNEGISPLQSLASQIAKEEKPLDSPAMAMFMRIVNGGGDPYAPDNSNQSAMSLLKEIQPKSVYEVAQKQINLAVQTYKNRRPDAPEVSTDGTINGPQTPATRSPKHVQ